MPELISLIAEFSEKRAQGRLMQVSELWESEAIRMLYRKVSIFCFQDILNPKQAGLVCKMHLL